MFWGKRKDEKVGLEKLYREMADGELVTMHATISDLTEGAQDALRREIERRGLELPSEDEDGGAEVPVPGGSIGAEGVEGLKLMHVFDQTFQAEQAFRALEAEEIEFKVKDLSINDQGEQRLGPSVQLALMVQREHWSRAVGVLRRCCGLFPEAVVDHDDGDEEPSADTFTVAQFESEADAEEAAGLLRDAGIAFTEEKHAEADWTGVTIDVAAEDVDRAAAVLERLLETASPEDAAE